MSTFPGDGALGLAPLADQGETFLNQLYAKEIITPNLFALHLSRNSSGLSSEIYFGDYSSFSTSTLSEADEEMKWTSLRA